MDIFWQEYSSQSSQDLKLLKKKKLKCSDPSVNVSKYTKHLRLRDIVVCLCVHSYSGVCKWMWRPQVKLRYHLFPTQDWLRREGWPASKHWRILLSPCFQLCSYRSIQLCQVFSCGFSRLNLGLHVHVASLVWLSYFPAHSTFPQKYSMSHVCPLRYIRSYTHTHTHKETCEIRFNDICSLTDLKYRTSSLDQ